MIRELVEYTETRGLVARAGYAAKSARWAMRISESAQYLGLIELGNSSARNNLGITFAMAPQLEQNELIGGGQVRSHFLIDAMAVIADWHEPDNDKMHKKHEFFVQLLKDASMVTPALGPWAQALSDEDVLARIRADAQEQKVKPTDRATMQYLGKYPVEDASWHVWWDGFRDTLKAGGRPADAECIVTGRRGPVVSTHPKIAGLSSVGGTSMGSVLVSFDKGAFSSYGLEQGHNAPMSEHVVMAYQSALNHLLKTAVDIGGMKVVYWYKEAIDSDDDPFEGILSFAPDSVEATALISARETITAARTGHMPGGPTTNRYYVALLSGVATRVMVRAWYEGAYEDIRQNALKWFGDLLLASGDSGPGPKPSFQSIIRHLSVADRAIPSPLVRSLWESAMFNRPIADAVARLTIDKVRHDVVLGDRLHGHAIGLLKAFIIRKKGVVSKTMSSALDVDRPEAAYHLGRLLAVLDSLQTAGYHSVRSGVSSRYYASASSMPALVFGRLLSLAQHHLARVEPENRRAWWRNRITEIVDRITDIPQTLTLEDQALFALGYYHQLAKPRAREEIGEENDDVIAD